jgi:hypothetical protein
MPVAIFIWYSLCLFITRALTEPITWLYAAVYAVLIIGLVYAMGLLVFMASEIIAFMRTPSPSVTVNIEADTLFAANVEIKETAYMGAIKIYSATPDILEAIASVLSRTAARMRTEQTNLQVKSNKNESN